jgi:hypothetical protein
MVEIQLFKTFTGEQVLKKGFSRAVALQKPFAAISGILSESRRCLTFAASDKTVTG